MKQDRSTKGRIHRGEQCILAGVALATAFFGQSVAAATETFTFDSERSTIGFRVHQFLGATNGKFTQFSGRIELDRERPESSSVSARIQVNSIDTGIKKRDEHLRSDEFFNAAKYPQIIFKSRSVKRTGSQTGDIIGDLTMHGVTKPITLHVKLVSSSSETNRTRWSVSAEPLKRRDFGLMFGKTAEALSKISQEVAVNIEIEAIAK